MSTTLVTGATGLIGSHVVRALVARGDEVRAVVPARSALGPLQGLDIDVVAADVTDRRAIRKALSGVDKLFHVPDATPLRAGWTELYKANVAGTRVVLTAALEAGVERVVHTSAAAAIGPAGAKASTVDETHVYNAARSGLSYANAKAEAEREALRICAQGLPVVIVNPAHVLGRDDRQRGSTELVRRFLRREIPMYVDGALCVVGAEDVAQGHLLAEERGVVGERYILGGRNFTNDRLFADLSRLSGVDPPPVKLPLHAALALARTLEALPGKPAMTVEEIRALSQRWSYRSTKARRDLGWTTGHHEQPLIDTIEWYRSHDPDPPVSPHQPLALRAAGFATHQLSSLGRLLGD